MTSNFDNKIPFLIPFLIGATILIAQIADIATLSFYDFINMDY